MRRFAIGLLLGCAVLPDGVSARGDEQALSQEEKSAGFESLFNGKDLAGWEEVQGKPGSFEVRDGILFGRRRDSAYWLSTKAEYDDFELRLEYNIPRGGNSGVFIRAPRTGRTSQIGMEIQIYDEGDRQTPGKGSTGAIYNVVPATKFAHRPPGEWNDLWILCEGDRVRVTINGEAVNDVLMSEHEALKNRPRKGYVGLSAHTDVAQYRHVRLRKIVSKSGK